MFGKFHFKYQFPRFFSYICDILLTFHKQLSIIFFQWVVGLFEEENKFSVIPSNWIVQLGNTTFCQWPKKRITDTMIINSENPAKDWQPFPVKIIEQYCK